MSTLLLIPVIPTTDSGAWRPGDRSEATL